MRIEDLPAEDSPHLAMDLVHVVEIGPAVPDHVPPRGRPGRRSPKTRIDASVEKYFILLELNNTET